VGTRRGWQLLTRALVHLPVVFTGFLLCCVRIGVAYPVVLGALAFAYEDTFGVPKSPSPQTLPTLGLRSP